MRRGATSERGFTLIEALVALAIGGFVIATLATITGQWMRNWRHGLPVLERAETLATSLDRVVADLAAARYMPASASSPGIIFAGSPTAVTFVRRSLPVESPDGLEVVRLAPLTGNSDITLARSRSPLRFGVYTATPSDPAPVTLLRPPFALRFAYAELDRRWEPNWQARNRLPRFIRVTVVDRQTGRALLAPIVAAVHVDAPLPCVTVQSARTCDRAMGIGSDAGPAGASPNPPAAADQL